MQGKHSVKSGLVFGKLMNPLLVRARFLGAEKSGTRWKVVQKGYKWCAYWGDPAISREPVLCA